MDEVEKVMKGNGKSFDVNCSGCGGQLEPDHGGIRCLQGHNLCLATCASNFADLVMAEPQVQLPPRCPECKVDINEMVFQRILKPGQVEKFQSLMIEFVWIHTLSMVDETLCQCPFCNYSEFRMSTPDQILFVHCQREGCGKISCFVCRQEFVRSRGREEDDPNLQRHFNCMRLGVLKREFEKVLELGIGVPCPSCKVIGRKDNACNHMKCQNCETDWCYVCGKADAELDKARNGSIYSHFRDWNANPRRCPMYFYQISDVDNSWPTEDEGALNLFHLKRNLLLLKEFYNKIGEAKWNELHAQFDSVKNCGFEKEEFLQASQHLFRRAR